MKPKCIVLLSGGLDSLLCVKIMQKQGFDVHAVHFKLPFSKDVAKDIREFSKEQKIKLKIFDCRKGRLLQEYLEVIKDAKFGRGAGINPCIDCKIFILNKAREFADKQNINLLVTGDVLDERPMSQTGRALKIIEEETNLKKRLLRPLSAKLLEKTNVEEKEIVKRGSLYKIHGRRREKQIDLAKKFKISYPNPAGGCLLCEKGLKKRFEYLLKRGINDKEIKLLNIGRHFVIDNCWVVIGRDEKENKIIEKIGNELITPKGFMGPSAIILDKPEQKTIKKVNRLIKAYSKKGSLKEAPNKFGPCPRKIKNKRKKWEKYKL